MKLFALSITSAPGQIADPLVVYATRLGIPDANVVINVFGHDPCLPFNRYIEEEGSHRMCLWGGCWGNPDKGDSYAAFSDWMKNYGLKDEVHVFLAQLLPNESRPGVNVYSVNMYMNLDLRCPVDEQLISSLAGSSLRIATIGTPIKNVGIHQRLARTGSQDLEDILVHLETVCDKLLPELVKETRETRMAIANLASTSLERNAHIVTANCDVTLIEHEGKSHPSHPEQ